MKRLGLLAFAALAACSQPEEDSSASPTGVVNVYSARHYDSDRDLYDAFEAQTGIKVRFREANASQLLETMRAEGSASPADVVIASDAGALWRFQDAGLLQPFRSDAANAAIPTRYREPDGHWIGLAKRVRVIAYDPANVEAGQVDDYADLADPSLDGEVCMRSSSNIYNLSLLGDLMARLGQAEAEAWASAVVGNFARAPQGGDTTQIESIAAGECSVALVNHYYWVRMTEGSAAQQAAASRVKLSFPSAGGDATHVNVTGAGVAANAPHPDAAIAFIEFLTSPKGQAMLVTETKEFPIVAGVDAPSGLEALPAFDEGSTPLAVYGANQARAQAAYNRAGWN